MQCRLNHNFRKLRYAALAPNVFARHKSSQKHIGLIGVKEDRNSSHLQGPAKAPSLIRSAFYSDEFNTWSELGVNAATSIVDFGDVVPPSRYHDSIFSTVNPQLSEMHAIGLTPLVMGGDHSISYSICKSIRNNIDQPITIVHFDAHPDIYESFNGDVHSHASPFARICEHPGLCGKLISIGIRTATQEQRDQITKYGVKVVYAKDFPAKGADVRETLLQNIGQETPVYISFDMDVLEPGLVPGVSHREAGGLTPRQVIDAIHAIPGRIIGADLVEFNPDRDFQGLTASVAGKLLKELAGAIIISRQRLST